jgi:hypothetical protein
MTFERKREAGQSCETCCHFIDYRDPDEDPRECNGYCAQLVDTLGFEAAVKVDGYGGFWTHSGAWCGNWEGGPPVWGKPAPVDAVDPVGETVTG